MTATPFQVLGLSISSEAVVLRLDDESTEPLDPETLCQGSEALYARVKAGTCEARFSRAAQGQLAPLLEETPAGISLRIGGRSHRIRIRTRGPD